MQILIRNSLKTRYSERSSLKIVLRLNGMLLRTHQCSFTYHFSRMWLSNLNISMDSALEWDLFFGKKLSTGLQAKLKMKVKKMSASPCD